MSFFKGAFSIFIPASGKEHTFAPMSPTLPPIAFH